MESHTQSALIDLPPFPPVANALLGLAAQEEVCLSEVTEILSTDAAISAELRRGANTAFVGARGEVDSVIQAAAILGLKRISSLAATIALRGYVGTLWQTAAVRRCWHHNLATALIAETMARKVALDSDVAYTAGLLHDVGRLALVVKFRGEYILLLNTPPPAGGDLRQLERERFGIDHTEAGSAILEQLKLPQVFRDSALRHHDLAPVENSGVDAIVRVACALGSAIGFGVQDAHKPQPDPAAVDAILQTMPPKYCDALAADSDSFLGTVADLIDAYSRALA